MDKKLREVYEAIPHRPPFLWVDEVVKELENGIIMKTGAKPDEAIFKGHYPGNPIMPGVILCEMVFQAAAVYMSKRLQREGKISEGLTPVLARIIEAKFKQIVRPGDELLVQANFDKEMGGFYFMDGSIKRGDTVVMTVKYAQALVEEKGK